LVFRKEKKMGKKNHNMTKSKTEIEEKIEEHLDNFPASQEELIQLLDDYYNDLANSQSPPHEYARQPDGKVIKLINPQRKPQLSKNMEKKYAPLMLAHPIIYHRIAAGKMIPMHYHKAFELLPTYGDKVRQVLNERKEKQ
jgi:hypothetical protein